MRLSPTLHQWATEAGGNPDLGGDIDFWYDSLTDCYEIQIPRLMLFYIEAINDCDTEALHI